MTSLIPGYEHDIFISYRQKDNKYDGWVTEFVDNLKRELEATFKEDISVYFDINPHDGLLETHDVDASLKEKLKCLVFVPIISRTYCDPKSFAWEHEFKAFVESASNDQFGLKVKLPNANVANRVLPVRIHDLDINDIKLCESVLGGALRGVEFIYKEPGVNRSLTPKDKEKKNLNGTIYRNQINKVALAIKEIILGMQTEPGLTVKEKAQKSELFGEDDKVKKLKGKKKTIKLNKHKLQSGVAILAVFIFVAVLAWPKIFKRDTLEKLRSSGERISIAVMPFQNMTNDTTLNVWQDGIQGSLISSLSNTGELRVRQRENINNLLHIKGITEYAAISPSVGVAISQKLDADIFISGSIKKAGTTIRVDAQLIDTKTKEVFKSFQIDGTVEKIFTTVDTLSKRLKSFLLISKLIKENPVYQAYLSTTNSPEALRYVIYGDKAKSKFDDATARSWYLKAVAIDSDCFDANFGLTYTGTDEQNLPFLLKLYKKRDQFSPDCQAWVNWEYAKIFESPGESLKYLKQIQELDDQSPSIHNLIGNAYRAMNQYDKAVTEYKRAFEICQRWGINDEFYYPAVGETYHEMGQYKEEKNIYKKAEHECPDNSSITFSWIIRDQATLALAEKDTVAANRYIKKLISVLKENSSSEAGIATTMAIIYREAGIPDKAGEYFRRALSLEPQNPGCMNDLANFFIESNRNLIEVSGLMDNAMNLAKNKIDYYDYLNTKGWGLYKQRKYKEALEILQKCWDEAPFKLYSIRSHLEEVKKAVGSLN